MNDPSAANLQANSPQTLFLNWQQPSSALPQLPSENNNFTSKGATLKQSFSASKLVHPEDILGDMDVGPDAQEINLGINNSTDQHTQAQTTHTTVPKIAQHFDQSEVIQLPEYLSEQLYPPINESAVRTHGINICNQAIISPVIWRRLMDTLVVLNRIAVRGVAILFCLLPGTFGFTVGLAVSIVSLFLMIPVIMYLLIGGWIRRKRALVALSSSGQDESTDLNFQFHNDPFDASNGTDDIEVVVHGDSDDENQPQEEEFTLEQLKPQVVPISIYSLGSVLFVTEFWGLYLPIAFEIMSWVILLAAILLRTIHEIMNPVVTIWNGQLLSWLMYGMLPIFACLAHNVCAFLVPVFDIYQALDLNDRSIVYNDKAMVLNNVCLDQVERTMRASNDAWEPCGYRLPVVFFDQIKEVSLAVSLETVSHKAINMPYLYISTIRSNTEHRFAMPIRLPQHNQNMWSSIFKHIISSPLNDGLSVDETVELLMRCVANRRKDLSNNISRVVRIIKTVQPFGYSP